MKLSILYAYRNRDEQRIKNSLQSLALQTATSFEVVFVDYGSEEVFAEKVQKVVESFSFASYHYIAHPGLLWNKSKALNYAASKAVGDYVFVADVDICFDVNAVKTILDSTDINKYSLFKLSYLKEEVDQEQIQLGHFKDVHIKHHGLVNGMIVVSKEAFFQVEGYDEFYHFYGSEDVDFYQRLQHLGLIEQKNQDTLFFHQWHRIYNSINDSVLEATPRFFNIKKINQQHYLFQQASKAIKPVLAQKINTVVWKKEDKLSPKEATLSYHIPNDHAKVWHLLNIILPSCNNEIVHITIKEDAYFTSTKFKIKKKLKKSDRVPMSMKEVNDVILERILLVYRHHNYTYEIASDLKTITFLIQL
ncbi:MAG: glycosyltransferase family 2 protein [Flavobacteriaceae bacterium]|nr:glycosyltransferase family 2 protein [Flavobacteriaceae bacterium]